MKEVLIHTEYITLGQAMKLCGEAQSGIEAKIMIQGIMRVSGKKNESDAIFNNSNINARNHAIATLADNETIFYIDVNEVVCDEEGNLNAEYTFDQIHLLGKYNDLWKQFLLSHGTEN